MNARQQIAEHTLKAHTKPAYDYFAKKWGVERDAAKRRILDCLYGCDGTPLTRQEADDVLEYLHGLNGRRIDPVSR